MAMARESRSVPGIIETLSAGFESINRIIWILLFPIGIDLLLWLAPRLSVASLVEQAFASLGPVLEEAEQNPSLDGQQAFEQVQQLVANSNLLGTISRTFASIPSVGPDQFVAGAGTIEVSSLGTAVVLFVALQLVGLALGAVYYGAIAQQVRDGAPNWGALPHVAGKAWLRILGFIGLVIGLTIAIGIPMSLAIVALTLVAQPVGVLLGQAFGFLLTLLYLWALLYLFFLLDAIVVSNVGPISAIKNSVRVVNQNFWGTIGLVALIFVISGGTSVIWSALASQPWGLFVSIIGNAYVMSGLAAASMVFYRNRLN